MNDTLMLTLAHDRHHQLLRESDDRRLARTAAAATSRRMRWGGPRRVPR